MEHKSTTRKRFIDAVNITPGSIEIISAAFGSNERHYSPTAEEITMKWGCSVTVENDTLNNTSKEWIGTAVIPLNMRYHTDLLSQDLCQIINRLYTDTFPPKAKSVSGHNCAQIFTDSERFVWITPLFSKVEFGMELRAFSRQVGIPKEIHFDIEAEFLSTVDEMKV